MTKQVALADKTYTRLRRQRLQGESFSAAIERLLDNQRKDPLAFAAKVRGLRWPAPPAKRAAEVEAEREATRRPA